MYEVCIPAGGLGINQLKRLNAARRQTSRVSGSVVEIDFAGILSPVAGRARYWRDSGKARRAGKRTTERAQAMAPLAPDAG